LETPRGVTLTLRGSLAAQIVELLPELVDVIAELFFLLRQLLLPPLTLGGRLPRG
jgi:hypothetical protein